MRNLILVTLAVVISACSTNKIDYNPLGKLKLEDQYKLDIAVLNLPSDLSSKQNMDLNKLVNDNSIREKYKLFSYPTGLMLIDEETIIENTTSFGSSIKNFGMQKIGTTISAIPTKNDDGGISVKFTVTTSQVHDIKKLNNEEQLPSIFKTKISNIITPPLNKWIAIGGLQREGNSTGKRTDTTFCFKLSSVHITEQNFKQVD